MSDSDPRTPLSPDELEQRQTADGEFEPEDPFADVPDRPLSADEIEQRQVAYDPDDDEERPA